VQRVFDHDTFSSDDIMGEAEVDLQPLITSAMAFGEQDFKQRKWELNEPH
jgi:stromal membrane-associated protein